MILPVDVMADIDFLCKMQAPQRYRDFPKAQFELLMGLGLSYYVCGGGVWCGRWRIDTAMGGYEEIFGS